MKKKKHKKIKHKHKLRRVKYRKAAKRRKHVHKVYRHKHKYKISKHKTRYKYIKHKTKHKKTINRTKHTHKTRHKSKKQIEEIAKPESSKRFLREMKKKENLSDKKEFEMLLKSIEINNPGLPPRILEAFRVVDRRFFASGKGTYYDMPLHVSHGQTISQPTTIARMLALLQLEPELRVLEVGANTGYHASLAAWLVFPGFVTSIEIYSDLAKAAEKNVTRLKKELKKKRMDKLNIRLIAGDALDSSNEIWSKSYDRIFYTAGVQADQLSLVKDLAFRALKEDGLLLFPTREAFDWGGLELWQKKHGKFVLLKRDPGYAFVPLIRQKDIEDVYKKIK